jgi:hypothetical protein
MVSAIFYELAIDDIAFYLNIIINLIFILINLYLPTHPKLSNAHWIHHLRMILLFQYNDDLLDLSNNHTINLRYISIQ